MLLRVSPVSSRSFKLIVMEVASGFGELEVSSVAAGGAGVLVFAISSWDGNAGAFADASGLVSAGVGEIMESSGGGSPEPDAAGVVDGCGLATSIKVARRRRVTMTVSPASLAMPP